MKRQWLFAAVLVTAAFFLLDAAWIPAKAQLAQFLLERSWIRTLEGDPDARPWPWADTRALGLLEIPGRGIRQVILSGTSGRNLAFGPTLMAENAGSDLVLSGHRDTHFSFLETIQPGELIRVTLPDGVTEFRVSWLEVVDSRHLELVLEPGIRRLTLMTCFPFDAITAGGPLRYVVTAVPG